MDKIKVLFYNSTLLKGGTEAYIKELIKCLDKSKFQIDIVVKDGDVVDEFIYNELKNCGCNVFLAKGSFPKRLLFLRKFFKQNKHIYDVAHINATSQGAGLLSFMAKKYGKIKKVIFHSHMGGNDNKQSMVDKIGSKMMFANTDCFVSCSKPASEFMFGEKFCKNNEVQVLNKSVDTNKFDLNAETRKKIRKELNLSNKDFAIIHVGRFAPQKNHKKLISVFDAYLKINPNAKLFLIGDGDLLYETKDQVKALKLENSVNFLGLKNNVQDYLQATDLFLFPSVHEGLGIVLVEAQCSGLPCVASNTVPSRACLCEDIFKFVELKADDNLWAEEINKFVLTKRTSRKEALKELGFDKETAAEIVEKIYLK